MTVDNQPGAAPVPVSAPVFATSSRRPGSAAKSWTGRSDAVQLSRLGGVLNVIATDASLSLNRVERLQTAVRDQTYSVTGAALGRKLMSEMLSKR